LDWQFYISALQLKEWIRILVSTILHQEVDMLKQSWRKITMTATILTFTIINCCFWEGKIVIAYIIWYMLNKVELPLNNRLSLCCIHINSQPFDVYRITARLELLIIIAVLIWSTGKIQQIKDEGLSLSRVTGS